MVIINKMNEDGLDSVICYLMGKPGKLLIVSFFITNLKKYHCFLLLVYCPLNITFVIKQII